MLTLMQCDTFSTPDDGNTERRQEGPPPPILPLAVEAARLLATLDSHMCLTSRIFTLTAVVDDQRGVVAKPAGLVDGCRHRFGGDTRRGNLVVNTPSDVIGPGLAAV